jgi:hypothetical protein
MNDETVDISLTLVQTGNLILQSRPGERRRIAQAYREARLLVATIPLDSGDARLQIIACCGIQIFTGRKMTLPVSAGY